MIKQQFLKIFVLGFVSSMSAAVSADILGSLSDKEPTERERELSKRAAETAKQQLQEGRVELVARRGLEFAVQGAIKVLRKEGYAQYASRKEREWMDQFSIFSHNLGSLDLGDHAPLSRWLAEFYRGLETRIDEKWLKLLNIYDLKIFNYGIPVALHPWANPANGREWGAEEYALHFVPVSAASVYWISSQACSLTVPFPFSLGCNLAARLPRYGMEHFVGPKLSDQVYKRFNP